MDIIAIGGATATGKTALSVALAEHYGGEIVSCDSMQLYRDMDIGTAKPTPEEMRGIPHYMISVADPAEPFSVGRYVEMAEPIVRDILARGKRVFLVGGTGLYMDALIKGERFAPAPSDALRQSLEDRWEALGGSAMLSRLTEIDPVTASRLHPSDKKRILRALEIYELTGKTAAEHDALSRAAGNRYTALRLNLTYSDRAVLYRRIDLRVDQMMASGLAAEVRALREKNCATALQAIGYKELDGFLRGECTEDDAVAAIKLASRRYAKRQLTWFRRHPDAIWLDRSRITDFSELFSEARRYIGEFDKASVVEHEYHKEKE